MTTLSYKYLLECTELKACWMLVAVSSLDFVFAQLDKVVCCFPQRDDFSNSFNTWDTSLCGKKHLLFCLHMIPSAVNFPHFLSLSPSLTAFFPVSLSLSGVIGQFSVSVHTGGIKPLLGVETPAACRLILKNAATKTLLLAATLSSFTATVLTLDL